MNCTNNNNPLANAKKGSLIVLRNGTLSKIVRTFEYRGIRHYTYLIRGGYMTVDESGKNSKNKEFPNDAIMLLDILPNYRWRLLACPILIIVDRIKDALWSLK